MLVLDGITVADMYFGCGLSKHLSCDSSVCRVRRRSFVYVLLVLYLYLVSCCSITENHYTSISLLVVSIHAVVGVWPHNSFDINIRGVTADITQKFRFDCDFHIWQYVDVYCSQNININTKIVYIDFL